MVYTFIDLFAGTGAFSHILEKKGCKCVFANDIVKESKEMYELNNPSLPFTIQHRERIYIIGFLDKYRYNCFNFEFKPKPNKTMLQINIIIQTD